MVSSNTGQKGHIIVHTTQTYSETSNDVLNWYRDRSTGVPPTSGRNINAQTVLDTTNMEQSKDEDVRRRVKVDKFGDRIREARNINWR